MEEQKCRYNIARLSGRMNAEGVGVGVTGKMMQFQNHRRLAGFGQRPTESHGECVGGEVLQGESEGSFSEIGNEGQKRQGCSGRKCVCTENRETDRPCVS